MLRRCVADPDKIAEFGGLTRGGSDFAELFPQAAGYVGYVLRSAIMADIRTAANLRYWPKADLGQAQAEVRFWSLADSSMLLASVSF